MEILEFKELNPVTCKMRIRIAAEDLAREFDKALDDLVKDTEIPGFRTGKAPRSIVERHVGREEIWRMARDRATRDAFEKALKEQGSSCVAEPDYQHGDYEGEGDLEVAIVYHPEPPSPGELMKRDQDRLFDKKGPDDHIPEHLKQKPLEEHQRRMRQGPTIEYSRRPAGRFSKGQKPKGNRKPE